MGNLCISLSQNASEGPNNGDLTSSPGSLLSLLSWLAFSFPVFAGTLSAQGSLV